MNTIENLAVIDFLEKYQGTENAILLDCRKPEEIKEGGMENTLKIDFLGDDFQNQIKTLDKSKAYFVYCRSGKRSMNACIAMQTIGIDQTTNLDGGYLAFLNYLKKLNNKS